MHLASPYSALLSAVVFNALIISLLVPLALRGVKYRPMPAEKLLMYNLLVYGLGGMMATSCLLNQISHRRKIIFYSMLPSHADAGRDNGDCNSACKYCGDKLTKTSIQLP